MPLVNSNYNFDRFDPDFADGVQKASPGNLAQVTVRIVNAITSAQRLELFNFLKSIANILNSNISAFNPFVLSELDTTTGSNPQPLATASHIYFDKDGNLIYNSAGSLMTISCTEVPYRMLFAASGVLGFNVKSIRYTVTNDAQLDNTIEIKRNSYLGGVESNRVSPRAYFDPNQQQSKVIDIPISFPVDAETGIEMTVNASETVSFAFFIDRYNKPTV